MGRPSKMNRKTEKVRKLSKRLHIAHVIESGDAYKVFDDGSLKPCPTMMTSSALIALAAGLKGKLYRPVLIRGLKLSLAWDKIGAGDVLIRHVWLKAELMRLTNDEEIGMICDQVLSAHLNQGK